MPDSVRLVDGSYAVPAQQSEEELRHALAMMPVLPKFQPIYFIDWSDGDEKKSLNPRDPPEDRRNESQEWLKDYREAIEAMEVNSDSI